MVGLPAVKFVLLGVRQITRPAARRIVTRATDKKGITRSVCITLGRLSLGLSGVIAEWAHKEEVKRAAVLKKSEEDHKQRMARESNQVDEMGNTEEEPSPASTTKSDTAKDSAVNVDVATKELMQKALNVAEGDDGISDDAQRKRDKSVRPESAIAAQRIGKEAKRTVNLVTPRSRSLLTSMVYGPSPKEQVTYDSTVFLDPKRTVGEAARVFIRHPYRSTWYVFRQTFLAPFPEDRLMEAGANLLIEILAFSILSLILFIELRQQMKANAAKEAHLQARIAAIEDKVNELVRERQLMHESSLQELTELPKLEVQGHLNALKHIAVDSYRAVERLLVPREVPPKPAVPSSVLATGAMAAPSAQTNSRIYQAAPPDPNVHVSKHDDIAIVNMELGKFLHRGGPARSS